MEEPRTRIGRRNILTGFAAIAAGFTGAGASAAATAAWPDRTVRVITPAAPGSSTDVAARLYAEHLSSRWGRQVVIEGRTGADGVIAVEALLQQRDGHALLFAPAGVVTVTPLLVSRLPFDPIVDIRPVALGALDFLCIAAAPAPELSTLSGLAGAIAERPGRLNLAAGLGGPTMVLNHFLRARGLEAVQVPYRSPPEAVADLVGGRLHALIGPVAPVLPLARSGRVRLLAVTNPERTPVMPEVPTVREQGFPELELEGTLGFFAPAMMPEVWRLQVAAAVASAAAEPVLVSRLAGTGIVARSEGTREFTQRIDRQRAHWADIAARFGTRPPS